MPIKKTTQRKLHSGKPVGAKTGRPRVRRPRLFLNPETVSESSFQVVGSTHLEYPIGKGKKFKYTVKPGNMVRIHGNKRKNKKYAFLGQVLADNEIRITHISENAGNGPRIFKKLKIHHKPGKTREFTSEFHFKKNPDGLPFAEASVSLGPLRSMHLTSSVRAEIIKPTPAKPKKQPFPKSRKSSA